MEMWYSMRHVNLYFRYVSGNSEISGTARGHTAWEWILCVFCCLSRKVTSHRSVNNAEWFHEIRKYAGAEVQSASLERRSEALHSTPHCPSYIFFWGGELAKMKRAQNVCFWRQHWYKHTHTHTHTHTLSTSWWQRSAQKIFYQNKPVTTEFSELPRRILCL